MQNMLRWAITSPLACSRRVCCWEGQLFFFGFHPCWLDSNRLLPACPTTVAGLFFHLSQKETLPDHKPASGPICLLNQFRGHAGQPHTLLELFRLYDLFREDRWCVGDGSPREFMCQTSRLYLKQRVEFS